MSEKLEVSIVSKGQIPKQWMKGSFHHNTGNSSLLSKKWSIPLGLITAIFVSLPFLPRSSDSVVSSPQVIPNLPTASKYKFPVAISSSTDDEKGQTQQKRRKRIIVRKFIGPKIFKRPRLGQIPPGALVKSVLLTGASNGPIKAKTTEALLVNGEELLEAGVTLLGIGHSTEERLFVRFKKLIHRDGTIESIRAQAADITDKIAGLKGSKLGSYAWRLAGGIGLNFAGGFAEGLKQKKVTNGAVVETNDTKNALLNGASMAALDLSREVMSDLKNKEPIIQVKQGTSILILFEGE